jgi:hypothetical protein
MESRVENYPQAITYLETVYRGNTDHRGIQKALGYFYAWTDQPERAAHLLSGLPEARGELETYAWWWGTQGRTDLAAYSRSTLESFPEP